MTLLNRSRSVALTASLALIPLASQGIPVLDNLDGVDLKLHFGTPISSSMRHTLYDDDALGISLGTSMPLKNGGAFVVELGYDYFAGRSHDTLPGLSTPIYYQPLDTNGNPKGGVVSSVPNSSGEPSPLYVQAAATNGSFEAKNRSFSGFSVRLGYQAPLFEVPDLLWQAGLTLDRYKGKSQIVGNLVPNYNTTDQNGNVTGVGVLQDVNGYVGYEGYAFNHEKTRFSPGAYAGLTYRLSPDFKLEFNVRDLAYRVEDYIPLAYTGKPAHAADVDGRGVTCEFVLCVKL